MKPPALTCASQQIYNIVLEIFAKVYSILLILIEFIILRWTVFSNEAIDCAELKDC